MAIEVDEEAFDFGARLQMTRKLAGMTPFNTTHVVTTSISVMHICHYPNCVIFKYIGAGKIYNFL